MPRAVKPIDFGPRQYPFLPKVKLLNCIAFHLLRAGISTIKRSDRIRAGRRLRRPTSKSRERCALVGGIDRVFLTLLCHA